MKKKEAKFPHRESGSLGAMGKKTKAWKNDLTDLPPSGKAYDGKTTPPGEWLRLLSVIISSILLDLNDFQTPRLRPSNTPSPCFTNTP